MAKKKQIVEVKDEVKKPVEVAEPKESKKKKFEYKLWAKVNDKEFEAETNDLEEAILSLKPDILYSALHMVITKNGKSVVKYLYRKDAITLFRNPLTRFVFTRNVNLLLK